jgi:hypothetical protein
MLIGKDSQSIQHPLFGISTKKWIQLLNENGGVDKGFYLKAGFITISSVFMTPARMLFKIFYEPKIEKIEIKKPPVFIIGHWRSGTTYLHELLSQDPQFCHVSLWNTLLPDSFLLLEPTKKFMSRFLPTQRPMDAIKVEIDGPYEEEAGLAVLCNWSFFHCFHFPRNAEKQYTQSIHFENLTEKEKNQWKTNYMKLLKTVTYANQQKRLLLKNPSNTGRIETLLDLFPGARFIHIYRNPYIVYLSTKRMRTRVLDKLALQHTTEEEIERHVINNYIRLMKSYFKQKNLIPKGKLVEIRYEDLVSDPIKQVKHIYSRLNLPGLKKALPRMLKYLEQKAGYRTNIYALDETVLRKVEKNWSFTITRWGYSPPQ